jgi:outer membrane protein assembly factor BamA
LTFGTHDDTGAKFIDADTIVFSSTATNPTEPVEADVARNGNIYNVWTLNLKSGELRQYSDAVGGNVSAIVLPGDKSSRLAFVSYYKGAYSLNTLERKEPLQTAAASDFGAPGLVTDFQAPLTHTVVAENKRRKGNFEKMFLDGRPPVNVGVTSGGDVFGGTQVTFSDVLGDKQFNMFAASISQYRTFMGSYVNLSRRLQYAIQGYTTTQFFYGQMGGVFYDPAFSGFIDRDLAQATRTVRGGSAFAIYPLNKYRRLEASIGLLNYDEQFNDPALEEYSNAYQQAVYGTTLFRNGTSMPLGAAFVQETTVFREFGPLKGSTMRLGYEVSPPVGNMLSRQTFDGDARYYLRLGGTGLLAMRVRGFKSIGDFPDFMYFGGNSEMRGYEYLEFVGHNAMFANVELRFPLIEAMLTPLGVLGGVRGVAFANVGGAYFEGSDFKFFETNSEEYRPIVGYQNPITGDPEVQYGPPVVIDGLRLRDARGSYGIGLETFALGFPIHFDWAWRTLFNKDWEDALFFAQGGSEAFRKPKFSVWIGYDF